MQCPHGRGPAKRLTVKQTEILRVRYMKLVGKSPAAYTADLSVLESSFPMLLKKLGAA